jgi:cytidyltransferase-like protein
MTVIFIPSLYTSPKAAFYFLAKLLYFSMSKTIVITSGYFNPIHPGHIECFDLSRKLGDELWVIVNSDHQAKLKRGVESFQDQMYRMNIVRGMKSVSNVILAIDEDGSVCKTLEKTILEIRDLYPGARIIWTKGGDRFSVEIPETPICQKYGVEQVDGMGLKTHNSSEYVKAHKQALLGK